MGHNSRTPGRAMLLVLLMVIVSPAVSAQSTCGDISQKRNKPEPRDFFTNQREVLFGIDLGTDCTYNIQEFEVVSRDKECQVYLELWRAPLDGIGVLGGLLQKRSQFRLSQKRGGKAVLPSAALSQPIAIRDGDMLVVAAFSSEEPFTNETDTTSAMCVGTTTSDSSTGLFRCQSIISQEADIDSTSLTCDISFSQQHVAYELQLEPVIDEIATLPPVSSTALNLTSTTTSMTSSTATKTTTVATDISLPTTSSQPTVDRTITSSSGASSLPLTSVSSSPATPQQTTPQVSTSSQTKDTLVPGRTSVSLTPTSSPTVNGTGATLEVFSSFFSSFYGVVTASAATVTAVVLLLAFLGCMRYRKHKRRLQVNREAMNTWHDGTLRGDVISNPTMRRCGPLPPTPPKRTDEEHGVVGLDNQLARKAWKYDSGQPSEDTRKPIVPPHQAQNKHPAPLSACRPDYPPKYSSAEARNSTQLEPTTSTRVAALSPEELFDDIVYAQPAASDLYRQLETPVGSASPDPTTYSLYNHITLVAEESSCDDLDSPTSATSKASTPDKSPSVHCSPANNRNPKPLPRSTPLTPKHTAVREDGGRQTAHQGNGTSRSDRGSKEVPGAAPRAALRQSAPDTTRSTEPKAEAKLGAMGSGSRAEAKPPDGAKTNALQVDCLPAKPPRRKRAATQNL